MAWKPLLEGELAQEASVAITEIVDGLREHAAAETLPWFSNGCAGQALFHCYHGLTHTDERSVDLAVDLLGRAFDLAARNSGSVGLFGGMTGMAWSGQCMERWLAGEPSTEATEEVDRALLDTVRTRPWGWHYDLVYGLAGMGCYVLEHPDRSFAAEVVFAILDRLSELAIPQGPGLTWKSSPALMARANAERYPAGHYNLGMSHGIAGVVGVLGRICGAGLAGDRARELLDGAVAWLLAQRRTDDGGSAFPYYLAPDEAAAGSASARSAWCYGDPGISAALLGAARAVGNPEWEREAITIARRDAQRDFAQTGVVDAELCHGTAGLGHLYNRLYQATGIEDFAGAARDWFRRTLELRRPGEGMGGFLNWWPEIAEWKADPGFLTGSAGIGLALVAAVSPVPPSWDAPMLLTLEPRETAPKGASG